MFERLAVVLLSPVRDVGRAATRTRASSAGGRGVPEIFVWHMEGPRIWRLAGIHVTKFWDFSGSCVGVDSQAENP